MKQNNVVNVNGLKQIFTDTIFSNTKIFIETFFQSCIEHNDG